MDGTKVDEVLPVNHEYQSLGVLEVVPPQRADLVLATNVPHLMVSGGRGKR